LGGLSVEPVSYQAFLDHAFSELVSEFPIGLELSLTEELIGRRLGRKRRVERPVTVNVVGQASHQSRLENDQETCVSARVADVCHCESAARHVEPRAEGVISVCTGGDLIESIAIAEADGNPKIGTRAFRGIRKIVETVVTVCAGVGQDDDIRSTTQQLVKRGVVEMPAVRQLEVTRFWPAPNSPWRRPGKSRFGKAQRTQSDLRPLNPRW